MSDSKASDDNKFATGAIRSADADHLDFLSMPLIGLIGMARTTFEGGGKYGRFNYMKGIPAHVCVNHAIRHLVMWGMGDRSEPHLSHAMWNCAAAEQSMVLHPELNAPHLPGPGYTLTPEIIRHLDEQAPILAERRTDGEWLKKLGGWVITGLAEIRTILHERKTGRPGPEPSAWPVSEDFRRIRDGAGRDFVVRRDAEWGMPVSAASPRALEMKPEVTRADAGAIPPELRIYAVGREGVRYEEAYGNPTPGPGETWCEFEGGHRLYWEKGT